MNIDLINQIKRLAIIALASDDELIENIVLKGGNAIDIVYHDSSSISRTSYDLDFSIDHGDFKEEEGIISKRIASTLVKTFAENGMVVFDYTFLPRPKVVKEAVADFWGGYQVTFKVLDQKTYDTHQGNLEHQRRIAVPLSAGRSTTFELEFSKFEYVAKKAQTKVDGYTIYVYTPEMIVFEKLRAICQQLPQYSEIIKSRTARARARDFYDIHLIMESHGIDATTEENKELIANIFEAKRVPLSFIQEIANHKAIHKDNWESVKDTVARSEELESFDFYFDYVVSTFQGITFP
ncbi:nucleotidyl transferase AbiEii/AbiGii toxin family protein [Rufibacter sp. XAAS-G3-1]|jgi:predicted nucleotidyltransferase component of viral defense system|uniref:nucleotidyl transferase AbiEii/AbiGii toxin family protein n=1 Tax=Rufibacter sp. XAAS-G3-1 TaxID=2729134 RepID=UPI0015E7B22C|nr:nucleotidyl transferase AbiEii/AbiGii toxin family protein [Rufibacter sp. XAAS-G3-1]